MKNVGRNDACPCGSGKKYKACCLNNDQKKQPLTGMGGRKFTAKVLSGGKKEEVESVEATNEVTKIIKPVDYNLLMEKSFAAALKKYPDSPPIPSDPNQYVEKDVSDEKK